ncbi:hypothetical protein Gasu2_46090 [Galdieria sulphuraria]|uniref:Uncharacterized protein n=1 Tax=Galdieria sulphuraria TaxID=130081 RepID=M2W7V9_GALSU|nr:uncharacterized protein Gasu_09780 [Galdieria sulphuraria]EME31911.1 hypothetical protein Gasu_09780 [Galdieria sulphuraria]GJD10418.1 hypothetical protein Gasu2_46090 [Galdieria sulphuraria]|eukprot:XP_005708431.1 hypothetical protein Gasu_09780 [Galdieria sulphuraria]
MQNINTFEWVEENWIVNFSRTRSTICCCENQDNRNPRKLLNNLFLDQVLFSGSKVLCLYPNRRIIFDKSCGSFLRNTLYYTLSKQKDDWLLLLITS